MTQTVRYEIEKAHDHPSQWRCAGYDEGGEGVTVGYHDIPYMALLLAMQTQSLNEWEYPKRAKSKPWWRRILAKQGDEG